MPQPSLNTVFLWTSVSCLRRLRASSSAARATLRLPVREMTRTEIVISSLGPELARARDHVAVRLEAFVVLAHDDEVDVVVNAADVLVGPRRAHVGEEVEMLAQDRVRIDGARAPSGRPVADRPEDEAVERRERLQRSLRHGRAMRVQRAAPDGHRAPVDRDAVDLGGGARDAHRGGYDLVSDVVAVEDADLERVIFLAFIARCRAQAVRSRFIELLDGAELLEIATMSTTLSAFDLSNFAKLAHSRNLSRPPRSSSGCPGCPCRNRPGP